MSDTVLALSTRVKPARKFTVDGEEYELLGIDHLSDADEAEAIALFARHTLLAIDLEQTISVAKGKEVATRLKQTRLTILAKLTTLPKQIAAQLPIDQQIKLLAALQEELEGEEDANDTGDPEQADGAGSGDDE